MSSARSFSLQSVPPSSEQYHACNYSGDVLDHYCSGHSLVPLGGAVSKVEYQVENEEIATFKPEDMMIMYVVIRAVRSTLLFKSFFIAFFFHLFISVFVVYLLILPLHSVLIALNGVSSYPPLQHTFVLMCYYYLLPPPRGYVTACFFFSKITTTVLKSHSF